MDYYVSACRGGASSVEEAAEAGQAATTDAALQQDASGIDANGMRPVPVCDFLGF